MSAVVETYDDRILANLDGGLSPQAAREVLAFNFSASQRQRMQELAAKARSGEATEEERAEADSFERVSSLLGILQSQARMALKQAGS